MSIYNPYDGGGSSLGGMYGGITSPTTSTAPQTDLYDWSRLAYQGTSDNYNSGALFDETPTPLNTTGLFTLPDGRTWEDGMLGKYSSFTRDPFAWSGPESMTVTGQGEGEVWSPNPDYDQSAYDKALADYNTNPTFSATRIMANRENDNQYETNQFSLQKDADGSQYFSPVNQNWTPAYRDSGGAVEDFLKFLAVSAGGTGLISGLTGAGLFSGAGEAVAAGGAMDMGVGGTLEAMGGGAAAGGASGGLTAAAELFPGDIPMGAPTGLPPSPEMFPGDTPMGAPGGIPPGGSELFPGDTPMGAPQPGGGGVPGTGNVSDLLRSLFGGLGGGNGLIPSLAGMWSADQSRNRMQSIEDKMLSMYSQDSPYAQNMRQELDRRDAAGGRRSQYGPRAVELQAKLADSTQRALATMYGANKEDSAYRNQIVNNGMGAGSSLLDLLGKNSNFLDMLPDWLKNLGGP